MPALGAQWGGGVCEGGYWGPWSLEDHSEDSMGRQGSGRGCRQADQGHLVAFFSPLHRRADGGGEG